jgi:Family of unknown function (DUF6884)
VIQTAPHPDVELAGRYGFRPTIHIVACGGQKQDSPAPARELYTGDVTRKGIAFASSRGNSLGTGTAYCLIASARHGILDLDDTVEPYNVRLDDLTPGELDEWRWMVVEQLADRGCANAIIEVHGGSRYVTELRAALPDATVVPFFKTPNTGIGQRKAAYKRIASREAQRKSYQEARA